MTSREPPTQQGGGNKVLGVEVGDKFNQLLAVGEQEFDEEIKKFDVRELLDVIACLQREMSMEQSHFDRLNGQFQNRKIGIKSPKEEDDALQLSAALCRSQIRLAQLCNRNMRCFTQQAARAQQDRSADMVKSKKQFEPPPLLKIHFNNNNEDENFVESDENFESSADDVTVMDEFDKSRLVRGPSVEDILQSVRSMRKDEEKENKSNGQVSAAKSVGDYKVAEKPYATVVSFYHPPSPIIKKNVTNEENLVPTATQLLLKLKPSTSAANVDRETFNEDEVEKKKTKVRKSILNHFLPPQQEEPRQPEESTSYGDDFPPPPPPCCDVDETVALAKDGFNLYGPSSNNFKETDGKFVNKYTNGSINDMPVENVYSKDRIRDKRGENGTLHDYGEPTAFSKQPPAASEELLPALNEEVPVSRGTQVVEDDSTIPSIIDQFVNVDEQRNRCRGTDVRWNIGDLIEKLYEVPQPIPLTIPPPTYINMEGYLEQLPVGRKQGTFWNAWKRHYLKLKDGYLFCYQTSKNEEPILCLQLMGGRIDIVESQILVDDGKGHCIMLRCNSRPETERWRRALLTHTAENYLLTYVQPVVPYPQFYEKVLIVDIGSCSVRAGILCNQPSLPQVYFPTVCAEEKLTGYRLYGKEALSTSVRLNSTLTFPLRPSNKITKFTVDMVAVKGILTKVFEDLNVDPSDYEIQLSLPRSFPFKSQTDVLDLLMTEFGVQGVNLMAQTVLALCSYNTTSGIVVDIGERLEVVPIVDGYVIESGVSRIPYGGSRLMDHLAHFLMQRHYGLSSITESFLLRYVLQQTCYCALDYKTELQRFQSQPEKFEDNVPVGHFFPQNEAPWSSIALDGGRFQSVEGLFRPELWGLDNVGIHKLAWKAIQECSLDVRKEMSRGIYLSGGVTMLPGFAERLQLEMEKLSPPTVQPKVHASPYRAHAAYLGACNWALSAGFHQAKITRNEWIASGSSCLKNWHF
ncbi:hypothetical protein CHUAL_004016 [Chamberlinius hualienensis]